MEEVAKYLRMEKRTLRRLIELGEFPRAIRLSPGSSSWTWKDVLYWSIRAELKNRLKATRAKKGKGPMSDNPGPTTGQSVTSGKRARPDA